MLYAVGFTEADFKETHHQRRVHIMQQDALQLAH
jgi:hypothetical protein